AKGILYATGRRRWPDLAPPRWLDLRDRPAPGEPFEPGSPVCTLVVRGPSPAACRRRLRAAAAWVEARLPAAGPRARAAAPPRPARTRPTRAPQRGPGAISVLR